MLSLPSHTWKLFQPGPAFHDVYAYREAATRVAVPDCRELAGNVVLYEERVASGMCGWLTMGGLG